MTSIKSVFLTGADGMLGSSICRELLRQGYKVKALILPGRNATSLMGLDIEIVQGDVLDSGFIDDNLADCDAVIHTAALTTLWPRRNEKVMRVNVEGTRIISEAAQKHHLQRMIFISSASSFTPGNKLHPGDESTPFSWRRFGMDYINSKYEAQRMLLQMHSENQFPVIIINPTYMIGPYDSGPSSGKMILALLSKSIPGYSKGGKNFVCSEDVAVAAVNALHCGRLGECYIAGNENLTYEEFFKKVCAKENVTFNLIRIPHFLILLVGLVNSGLSRITTKPPNLSYTMARVAGIEQYFSSAKANRELKMPQTPIEDGIAQCINWFKSNGYYN